MLNARRARLFSAAFAPAATASRFACSGSMNSRYDLAAEAIAGAAASVAAAVILDRSQVVKRAAARVPRFGWKVSELEQPPLLARLAGTAVATIVFRTTFSLTRTAARKVLSDDGPLTSLKHRRLDARRQPPI